MKRWLNAAARLYPQRWRDRYGAEFDCLLSDVQPRWTDVMDVLRGAVMMQFKTLSSYLKLVGAVALAGAMVAIGVSFVRVNRYVSSAIIQRADHISADDPQAVDGIAHAWQDVTSPASLSELIQRPNLDLYKSERTRQPLEDVIEDMKKDHLRIETWGGPAFRVSFDYPDRYKAQGVVDAVTKKVISADRSLRVADPASLPGVPVKPNRLVFMMSGLGIGLLAGVVASFFRWRARWTMKVIGFGLAGCAIAAGLSLLLPNRYTSRAVLRVLPAPKADGVRRYMSEPEMADWLREKEKDVLGDGSLSEIIQRPSLHLYDHDPERQPIGPVIARMRRDVSVKASQPRGVVTISFTYRDRFKAQATVTALITRFIGSDKDKDKSPGSLEGAATACVGRAGNDYWKCFNSYFADLKPPPPPPKPAESIDLLDRASLPKTSDGPDRRIPAGAGLLAGLALGVYVLRKRAARELAASLSHA